MAKTTYGFHNLGCTITHIKHHQYSDGLSYGHGRYPHGEYYPMHPAWNCHEWEVALDYNGKSVRPFSVYTPSEIDSLDKTDVLMIIFNKDYRTTNLLNFSKTDNHAEYMEFFQKHEDWFESSKEIERTLQNYLKNGRTFASRLYNLLVVREEQLQLGWIG